MTLNEVLDTSRGAVDDADTQPERKRTKLGVANAGYFQPGPMNSMSASLFALWLPGTHEARSPTVLPLRRIVIEHRMPPALLIEKIVSIEEVVELFALFFEHCHRACPILDPEVHTPTATGSRSPFLFTCSMPCFPMISRHFDEADARDCLQSAASQQGTTPSERTTCTASASESRSGSRSTSCAPQAVPQSDPR